jgi:hypothetical protein
VNFLRLLKRDITWHFKPLLCLSLAACLVCAVLTSALLIGESVRGTLVDNLKKGTGPIKTLLRFPVPFPSDIAGGVLHTSGFITAELKTNLYAFANNNEIRGRDAYCSNALAEALKLDIGETFTVRVLTMATIASEDLMGMPPELKQIRLVFKGVLPTSQANVNFNNPQLRPYNLFINHDLLARTLAVRPNVINEAWIQTDQPDINALLSDSDLWELSSLQIDQWHDRPILKSKAYFLPNNVVKACPVASEGLITFAKSLTDSSGNAMDYFFIGAFEDDFFPVNPDGIVISQSVKQQMTSPVDLACFVGDDYRRITEQVHHFAHVSTASDAEMSSVLSPDIPGLTDVADCSQWIAGLPIDLNRIQSEDKDYWETYKSKPKVYMNFAQAQKIFSPGRCSLLIFKPDNDPHTIKKQIIDVLRKDTTLFQSQTVAQIQANNIQEGVAFTPLFLGLSLFIIISGLLILGMLLKLHLFDRTSERELLSQYVSSEIKIRLLLIAELLLALLPGIMLGLGIGVLLCFIQLSMLEHTWNEIIGMNAVNFHVSWPPFLIASVSTFVNCSVLIIYLLGKPAAKPYFHFQRSYPSASIRALGTLYFFRRFRQYRLCIILLVLGIIGTLGVGAFGIKVRGEDGFSYQYVAQTAVPVVPSFDSPFPPGGLPVRVYQADFADCSNLLRAAKPTVYGCDIVQLTGQADFLSPYGAASDAGSLQWIIKKKLGETIVYNNHEITLQRALKASVFQRGILVNNATFQEIFPDVQGAQFFLIRDKDSAEAYRTYLQPYGMTLISVDTFMARAEHIQNGYLAIFLQLGMLGFLLGTGSLVLMILRNLHAQRNEILFLYESGWTRASLFRLYFYENGWTYGLAVIVSFVILCLLMLVCQINVSVLLVGWLLMTVIGLSLIWVTLKQYFSNEIRICNLK